MRSIYEFLTYKEYLHYLVDQPTSQRGTKTRLAKAIGCQAAYFSQVLTAKAELSEDQALKLARFLELSQGECEYLLLMVRSSRASTRELRSYLETTRLRLVEQIREVKNRISSKEIRGLDAFATQYFATWVPSTLHVATSSDSFQTAEALAKRFNLELAATVACLKWLEEVGLVELVAPGRWKFKGTSIHLPKESLHNSVHQTNRRMQAIKSIQQQAEANFHVSSVFTVDRDTYDRLREILLQAFEKAHVEIHDSGTDEVYALCMDLFRVV